jgi:hypothetical protein
MLDAMEVVISRFYPAAVNTHVHAFIEFCGLMHEFLQMCRATHEEGRDFTMCNTHTGEALVMKPHHVAYLAEKLGCIYGPALTGENARELVRALVGDGGGA